MPQLPVAKRLELVKKLHQLRMAAPSSLKEKISFAKEINEIRIALGANNKKWQFTGDFAFLNDEPEELKNIPSDLIQVLVQSKRLSYPDIKIISQMLEDKSENFERAGEAAYYIARRQRALLIGMEGYKRSTTPGISPVMKLDHPRIKEINKKWNELSMADTKDKADAIIEKAPTYEDTPVQYTNHPVAQAIAEYRASLSGQPTLDQIQHAAEIAMGFMETEIGKHIENRSELLTKAQKLAKDALDTYKTNWHQKTYAQRFTEYEAVQSHRQEADQIRNYYFANACSATISKIRAGSKRTEKSIKKGLFENQRAKDADCIAMAMLVYPADFVEAALKRQKKLTINGRVQRGYYSEESDTIAVGGEFDTAIHELGHNLERRMPGILKLEREFYERRTKDEKLVRLNKVQPGTGYSNSELTKTDKFIDPYMGKDYAGSAYELVSMGFQYFFTDPQKLQADPDYFKFILGILLLVG